jgi:flavorubredoxin
MSAIQLRPGLWSVGVQNPNLRVFDIVMPAAYGTSYNAYLLTGEKNVLIETVHADFFQEYVDNIQQVLPLERVDYLIMNHTEPDHSGSVPLLLERCPNLTVVCSPIAKRYLDAIVNRPFPCQPVKEGDALELGEKTLRFLPAPMVHWPDTMFTWDEADKTLFTCDFLGAHYCEPTMVDSALHYPDVYIQQQKFYYDCIMGPFAVQVRSALSKVPKETQLVCPSHGPTLSATLPGALERYAQWSAPAPVREKKLAAVLYCSAYGCTGKLAQAAADALTEAGLETALRDVTFTDAQECSALANDCDLLLVGSPTLNRDAPKVIFDVLHSIDVVNVKYKPAGAFGSYGWSGEAPDMLLQRLAQMRFNVPETALRFNFMPTEEDLAQMKAYALDLAGRLSQK